MYRVKSVSTLLFYAAAILVSCVFILNMFTPVSQSFENISDSLNQKPRHNGWLLPDRSTEKAMIGQPLPPSDQETTKHPIKCDTSSLTIEQYRSQSLVRGVIVRFPSSKPNYYFVQFRWFYRSWIETEMFTLERWRTDIIILIDDRLQTETRQYLEQLNCRIENERSSRKQPSRCIVVMHQLISQRPESEQKLYVDKYTMLNRSNDINENIDRIFAIYDYTSHLNKTATMMYDFIMVTTMNTFLTTQFGKYVPLKCAFLIGAQPDYSTWFAKTEQIIQFANTLLYTLQLMNDIKKNVSIDYSITIEELQNTFLFVKNQVDISCDSTKTTYRTSIYHLKCYAHSTSLFSERMFRENAYDGYEKEPFNIYIAREYAVLMALQSKVMSIKSLESLAANVTRRQTN